MSDAHAQGAPSPFDFVAAQYESNPITDRLRPVVWKPLLRSFHSGSHILELNCGTGKDAVALAERGILVTAIDTSREMIRLAKEKIESRGLTDRVELRLMSFDNLPNLLGESKTFDGAFSNFGGLNCAEDLGALLGTLSRLLKPGALFFACVLNKLYPWEVLAFLARGKMSHAIRRLSREQIIARIGPSSVPVRYYTPREFASIASPWFAPEGTFGLSILSPNANSRRVYERFPGTTDRLMKLDDHVRHVFPFYALGDLFVVRLRNTQTR